ncbi:MFS transporter [Neobacillus drentensis]|uniref:MFS transporter n=1 Tax=Neobacillus drentensis TaxID=220684 RepID=UPI000A7B3D67|nr:MFS transporter [Neobacillus drentensis]
MSKTIKAKNNKLWIIVLVSSFLGLMVDAMDVQMLSLSLPDLMEEFKLTKVEAGAIATWSIIGMSIGGLISGWLSDRIGRVKVITWSMLIFSIGTGFLAFVHTYEQFIILRFFTALGLGAEFAVANMLVSEYVPTEKRTTIGGSVQAGWSVGYLVATVVASLIMPNYGWRPLFLVGLIPVLLAIYMRFTIPEPEGWKESVQRKKELRKAKKLQNEWISLFKEPQNRKTLLLWVFTAIFLQFGYYGVSSWLPTYLIQELHLDFKNMTSYLVGTYTAMIIGKIITGILADKFERRKLFAIGAFSTAFAIPIIVHYHTAENIVILLTLFGFLFGMQHAVNAVYMNESFPTDIRGTAVGAAHNIGRGGSAIAPILIGMIAMNQTIGYGFLLLAVAYALSGLLPALFIREKMYDPFESGREQNHEKEESKEIAQ